MPERETVLADFTAFDRKVTSLPFVCFHELLVAAAGIRCIWARQPVASCNAEG